MDETYGINMRWTMTCDVDTGRLCPSGGRSPGRDVHATMVIFPYTLRLLQPATILPISGGYKEPGATCTPPARASAARAGFESQFQCRVTDGRRAFYGWRFFSRHRAASSGTSPAPLALVNMHGCRSVSRLPRALDPMPAAGAYHAHIRQYQHRRLLRRAKKIIPRGVAAYLRYRSPLFFWMLGWARVSRGTRRLEGLLPAAPPPCPGPQQDIHYLMGQQKTWQQQAGRAVAGMDMPLSPSPTSLCLPLPPVDMGKKRHQAIHNAWAGSDQISAAAFAGRRSWGILGRAWCHLQHGMRLFLLPRCVLLTMQA